MSTGSTIEPSDPVHLLTTTTSPVQTSSGSDVLMSTLFANSAAVAHRIFCGSTGSIAIKRINDAAFVVYPATPGQYIDGRIVAVGGTSSGTSASFSWIAEV